jgi:hydroxymethylbilane synthase
MDRTWRLATRGSQLARAQSTLVAKALEAAIGEPVELLIVRTRGDAITDRPLSQVGGKGLFTKEIEEALYAGDADFAVHSLKDLPTDDPPGLIVAATPERADPRDVLVGATLDALKPGAVVGTGSARRRLQLLARRPDLEVRGIRGNVDTRIAKQVRGEYDAVVLAAAGLDRLGRGDEALQRLDPAVMCPAVGQGALAIQCREDDAAMRERLAHLHDATTGIAITAERAFLDALQGGCSVPAACHAVVDGDQLTIRGFFGRDDGVWVSEAGMAPVAEAAEAGVELATRLRVRLGAQPTRSPNQD